MGVSWPYISLVFVTFGCVSASWGDQSNAYRECTYRCRREYGCPNEFGLYTWTQQPCFGCKYDCMWSTVESFHVANLQTPQFHGKWPFVALRIGGLIFQEPASVLFSLLNLYTVLQFYNQLSSVRILKKTVLWKQYCRIGMVTWISSALFHTSDFWLTEYMDYFSASAFVFAGFYVSVCFTVPFVSESPRQRALFPALLVLYWIYHVYSMLRHFDYGHNMNVCLIFSVFTVILHLRFLAMRYFANKGFTRADWLMLRSIFVLYASVAFEMLDFAPILWTIDAHSLFHLATIPVPLWFSKALYLYSQEVDPLKDV